ncbi:ABC transporter ATP-binding protein [Candidatus Dependentiae bacterium]|nr:MAG: ABC transporter ATP-binding protein [Candidatus Dependentiae bacterium]
MQPLISIINVVKTYKKGSKPVNALNNVSFDIHEGEIFGLLGVNGAGKTTLSSILATLHPVSSGDILFKGKSIYNDVYAYRKKLGFCPQYQNLDSLLTVRQNLEFAGRYYLIPETEIQKRVRELLQNFELERYQDFKIDALSGGNKQRVLIARAMLHRPALILLDEPTVGLDPDIRKKLWDMIKDLKKEGVTVVLTTHYLDEAEYLSDRICILHKGKVIKIETVETLIKTGEGKKLEDIFITFVEQQQD